MDRLQERGPVCRAPHDQHREVTTEGFAHKYGCRRLVFCELFDDMDTAIAREKEIKAGSRRKKLALIEGMNPSWDDVHPTMT